MNNLGRNTHSQEQAQELLVCMRWNWELKSTRIAHISEREGKVS